ncbi:DUF697 domain-containing protein [Roseomonas sp. CCTCC AB2023176]|uniref:DUF697 domain-containing protein n=1 Tax=Roseomonas sp. CCTCC AB2023176 TaxID=3342640 RepID=UPI0035E2FCDB
MSDTTTRGPRIILEDEAGTDRVEARPPAVLAPAREPRTGPSTLSFLAAGIGVLVLGLSTVESGIFVADAFARHAALGWLTLAVAAAGYGLVGWGLWREAKGLIALNAVDAARAAFTRGDVAAARSLTLAWASDVPAAAPHLAAMRNAPDVASLRALLESGPLATLAAESRTLGWRAGVQAGAATLVAPSPAWDALFVGWRAVRLVRQVAVLHGLRPGFLATMKLLRRAAFDAAAVATTEVAVDLATSTLATHPWAKLVIGDAATGAVAIRRLIRLAAVTAEECRIVARD